MKLADLLKETLSVDCDEIWGNERTPTCRGVRVCFHSMGYRRERSSRCSSGLALIIPRNGLELDARARGESG